ncbi:unnamed protein product, partial [Effrenium voratum]
VLEVICEFGSAHPAMTGAGRWSSYGQVVSCAVPPLSRRLVAAPEMGQLGYSEEVTVQLHLRYYVFDQGWKRTDSLDFTWRAAAEVVLSEPQPRVLRVLPGLLRFAEPGLPKDVAGG